MAGSSPAFSLELLAIEKSFGGVRALRGAHLSARPGEILGLCGENGAGKSTLLKILGGVHPRASYGGTVRVHGEERGFASTRDAEQAGIAVVHQELMVIPELSVASNLVLGHEPTRRLGPFDLGLLDDEAMEVQARALLTKFGVEREIDPSAPVATLGIGLRQVVEIVRALSREARILVLDEPTAALTRQETERLMAWLRELRDAGTTCLYVSHHIDEVFALCDRVTVLRDGCTVGTVDVKDTTPDAVVEMMVGRAVLDQARRAAPHVGTREVVLEVRDLSVPLPTTAAVEEAGAGGEALARAYAVEKASFVVHGGEVVAVCGAMGSGRTALLSTLFGCAARGFRGSVRVSDRELALRSPRDAVAAGLALVPEDRKGLGLVMDMSVAQNLTLPLPLEAEPRGLAARLGFIDEEAEELLAQRRVKELSIRGAAGAAVATLSGGNQQKVVLGKWLESPPRVLLLDEPTRGVDVGAREEIYALLERLAREGVAVLLASSDLAEVLRLAHRVVVLRGGRVVAELDGRTTTEAEIVALATGATGGTT